MKKVFFISAFFLFTSTNVFSFWPFGSIETKLQKLENSTEKNWSDIKAGLQDNKTGINDVSANIDKLTTEVGVVKDNVIKLTATVQANANAKVESNIASHRTNETSSSLQGNNNTQSQTTTNTTTTTNDPALMRYIIRMYQGIVLQLIGLVGFGFKYILNQNTKLQELGFNKDFYMSQLLIKTNSQEEWSKVVGLKDELKLKKKNGVKGIHKGSPTIPVPPAGVALLLIVIGCAGVLITAVNVYAMVMK